MGFVIPPLIFISWFMNIPYSSEVGSSTYELLLLNLSNCWDDIFGNPLLDTAGTHTIIITHYLPCRPAWPGYPSLGMSILTSLAFDSPIRSMKG